MAHQQLKLGGLAWQFGLMRSVESHCRSHGPRLDLFLDGDIKTLSERVDVRTKTTMVEPGLTILISAGKKANLYSCK